MEGDPGTRDAAGTAPDPNGDKLAAYVAANYGRFTDAVIAAELTKAGYAAADISAALANAARNAPPSQTRRATWTILVLYGVTFALLSLGMLADDSSTGYYVNAAIGILILGVSLGVALLLSLAWVGSRRGAALLLAFLIIIYGFGTFQVASTGILVIGVGVALAVFVLRRPPSMSRRSTATLGALLSVPMILLVIIAGLCVATGMPIPRVG